MTIYDDMMAGAIDVHCHIDFEFSAKEQKQAYSATGTVSAQI